MKKLNQLKMVVVLVVGTLIPGVAMADYASSTPDVSTAAVSSLLSPSIAEKPGQPGSGAESLKSELAERVKEIDQKLNTSKKEQKLRQEVAASRDEVDRLKNLTNVPGIIVSKKIKDEEKKNNALENQFSQLTTLPGTGVQQSDLDINEAACSKNVNTQQFKQLSDQMQSEPFNFLRKEGGKLVAERKKALKEKGFENFFAMVKKLKENNKKKAASKDEFQPKIADVLGVDIDKPEGFEEEARLGRLEADKKKLAEAEQTWNDKLLDATVDMVKKLKDLGEKKEATLQLAAQFADNLEAYRRAMLDAGIKMDAQLYKNCKNIAKKVGRDAPLAPNSRINAAYQMVVAAHNGDANYYANGFLQSVSSEARQHQCRKAAPQIDGFLGATMQGQINQVRSASDANTLLQGALATMNSLGAAQTQAGQAFAPTKQACNELAKFSEKLDNFVASAQQQIASQGQPQIPGVARSNTSRNPVGGLAGTNQRNHIGSATQPRI